MFLWKEGHWPDDIRKGRLDLGDGLQGKVFVIRDVLGVLNK